ncbi:MAG: response regulator [Lachnospiraceae bacterium]|nr:response regulator [Lachnospiraceae bacterium]
MVDGLYAKRTDGFNGISRDLSGTSFLEYIRSFIRRHEVKDSESVVEFAQPERLISVYQSGKAKTVKHIHAFDPEKKDQYFEVTFCMYEDSGDIMSIVALKDETSAVISEKDNDFKDIIINSLSVDFGLVSYINLDTDVALTIRANEQFKEYKKQSENLSFKDRIKLFSDNFVFVADREKFMFRLSKETIISELSLGSIYVFTYRASIEGSVKYYQIKIIKNYSEANDHIVICGIRNIDEEMRHELEQRNTIEGMLRKAKIDQLEMDEKDHERVRREEELRRNHQIIEILASEYSSVYYVDLITDKLTTYSMNDDFERDFGGIFRRGIRYSDAYELYVSKYIYDDDKDMMREAGSISNIISNLTDQKSYTVNFRSSNDGNPQYCEMKFVKVGNDRIPKAVALAFANKDIEIRRENERQLQLEEAKAKAEAANKAKSSFLFNMSHDIRTPMNAIMGFANMALKYIDDKTKATECLEKINISGKHLVALINDVLDMARIESGKVTIEENSVNMEILADSILSIVRENAENNGLKLVKKFKGLKGSNVYADSLRLSQVLINVIGNSIKYTKPGGTIIFSITKVASMKPGYSSFAMKVSDNGIGMSKEFVDHVFESFSREKTSTVSGIQGTGLGMSITQELVKMMNGTITIESELNVGTNVTMRFSFRNSEDIPLKIDNDNDIEKVSLKGLKVLLVEDNELNREIAKDILESEGIIVHEAEDGSVAVSRVIESKNSPYDVILMDIQMPYMDGYKATAEIRHLPYKKIRNIPIIAMTANAFEEDKKRAINSGMNDHLTKPINNKELIRALVKYIKKD